MNGASLWVSTPETKSDNELLAIAGRGMKELYVDSLIGGDISRSLPEGSPLLDILQTATEKTARRLRDNYLDGHFPRLDDSKDVAEWSLGKILERFRGILCAEIAGQSLGSSPKDAVVILAPTLITLLDLPVQHAAIAVPLSILIGRMAIRALCAEAQEVGGDSEFLAERIRICKRNILALDAQRANWPAGNVPGVIDEALTREEAKLATLMSTKEASMTKSRILFLAANPLTTSRLDLEEELRGVEQELRAVRLRDHVEIVAHHAVRPDDLLRYVRSDQPRIIHFSGHGSPSGIMLRTDSGEHQTVPRGSLQRFLQGRGVELVVLNACFTAGQAEEIASSVRAVIGTSAAVGDEAARRFSCAFYRSLGDGLTVADAFRDGGDAVALHGLTDVFQHIGEMNWTPIGS